MAIALVILFILSLYHFIYDGIIAPSERLNIRYKMFKLRDELRMLKIENGELLEDDVFDDLNNSLNNAIKLLPFFNLPLIFKAVKEFKEETGLIKEIAIKNRIIQDCKIEEVKDIHKKINDYLTRALFINMGGWAIYALALIIIIVPILLFDHMTKKISSYIKLQIEILSRSSVKEVEKLTPDCAFINH